MSEGFNHYPNGSAQALGYLVEAADGPLGYVGSPQPTGWGQAVAGTFVRIKLDLQPVFGRRPSQEIPSFWKLMARSPPPSNPGP